MLDTLFLSVLNMSITAGIVILVVLPVRLLLRRAPKIFSYALCKTIKIDKKNRIFYIYQKQSFW